MGSLIKASDFAKYLEKKGLIIVKKSHLALAPEAAIYKLRMDLLKRKYLTLREILMLELLPVKSKSTLERWIANETFLPLEVSRNRNNQIIILTSSLTRLGYV